MSRRWRGAPGGARTTVRSLIVSALLLAAACAAPQQDFRRRPGDFLTDLTDDGSLLTGAFRSDPETQLVALRGLARLPPGDGTHLLLELADGPADAPVLAELCFTLGQWRAPEATDTLKRLAGHSSSRVRAAALTALGRLQDDALTPVLVAGLGDPSADVREAAALGLFRLDGRRYDHERTATEEQLAARDTALAEAALRDDHPSVRWRATYALAGVRSRPGQTTVLTRCLRDDGSPLARVFALRGLAARAAEGLVDAAALARPLLQDADERVVIEAAAAVLAAATPEELLPLAAGHPSVSVRRLAWQALPEAAGRGPVDGARDALVAAAEAETSPMVRRAAFAGLAALPGGATRWLPRLADSESWRDREAAASLLADGTLTDEALLERLLDDPVPAVHAAALGALARPGPPERLHRLVDALGTDDPAVRASAAEAAAPAIEQGRAPPWLVSAVADALDATAGFEMEEARSAMAEALGLPPLDPTDVPERPEGRLLDRLLAEHEAARADPRPRVRLETTRGPIEIVLDRLTAPRHVASFLELAASGFYDGLDIHRVVPDFVVQGLDPRGDGWGTGGRRLPDEFSPTPFLSGTLGMPHAGSPHTGGCQIFITLVPTPHLDGAYTAFGRVVEGLDVVAALQIGDVVSSVRRVDSPPAAAAGTATATAAPTGPRDAGREPAGSSS